MTIIKTGSGWQDSLMGHTVRTFWNGRKWVTEVVDQFGDGKGVSASDEAGARKNHSKGIAFVKMQMREDRACKAAMKKTAPKKAKKTSKKVVRCEAYVSAESTGQVRYKEDYKSAVEAAKELANTHRGHKYSVGLLDASGRTLPAKKTFYYVSGEAMYRAHKADNPKMHRPGEGPFFKSFIIDAGDKFYGSTADDGNRFAAIFRIGPAGVGVHKFSTRTHDQAKMVIKNAYHGHKIPFLGGDVRRVS